MQFFSQKKQNRFRFLFIIFTLALLFIKCTHNPFGSDENIFHKNSELSGKVDVKNQDSPKKAFVWLEGFDIGTWTDDNGLFKIRIPPRRIQPGEGLSGSFKFYFYVSNYKLDSSAILIKNGELQLSHGNIDDTGKLRRAIFLQKTLNIETNISPSSVPEDYTSEISVELLLQATDDTVTVKFPDKAQGPLSILFFVVDNKTQNSIKIFENNVLAIDAPMSADSITTVAQIWSSGFEFTPYFLPQGEYKIIPYLIIKQQAVPKKLLENFETDIEKPVIDFINVPTRRDGGNFKITPGGETLD